MQSVVLYYHLVQCFKQRQALRQHLYWLLGKIQCPFFHSLERFNDFVDKGEIVHLERHEVGF